MDLAKEEKQNIPLVELTDEQKAIFSYFMPVKGMEDQLCKALTVASSHLKNKETASRGNLVIKGGQGSGKTTLATSMIKVLQQETGVLDGKIGKIHAEALNQKNVSGLLDKVSGGCLIIEQAGDMEKKLYRNYPICWMPMRVVSSLFWKIHPRASRDYLRRMKHLPKIQ